MEKGAGGKSRGAREGSGREIEWRKGGMSTCEKKCGEQWNSLYPPFLPPAREEGLMTADTSIEHGARVRSSTKH